MFLNLLYRSLKADQSISRVRSFVKRLVQTGSFAQVPFLCGSLFLLSELCNERTGLWSMITQPEEHDEEESFHDVSDSETEKPVKSKIPKEEMNSYDGRKRDPLFTNADKTCLWELIPFASHFHPTVSLYARTLLSGSWIPLPKDATNYDPLLNHSLTRFLERFIYKAPKKLKSVHHGSSIMQPRISSQNGQLIAGGRRKASGLYENEDDGKTISLDDTPVNEAKWENEEQVPVDEVNIY
jgi:ribosome biogenesis protein MAK21